MACKLAGKYERLEVFSKHAGTYLRPEVASKSAGTYQRLEVASSLLVHAKDQKWLLAYWHMPKTKSGPCWQKSKPRNGAAPTCPSAVHTSF